MHNSYFQEISTYQYQILTSLLNFIIIFHHRKHAREELYQSSVFGSDLKNSSTNHSTLKQNEPTARTKALPTPVNKDFYRLVHSPIVSRSESVTSWSIPEIFRFSPTTHHFQSSAAVFENTPVRSGRFHDRVQKMTSLSSNYRKRLFKKSRKHSTYRRNKLSRMEPLRSFLYLGKDTTGERSLKRSPSRTRSLPNLSMS